MRLDRLARQIVGAEVIGEASADVTAVVHDLRDVFPGALFCCVRGSRVDGHELAAEAVSRGAAALVVERPVGADVAQIRVANTRAAMGPLAAELAGHPSRHLKVCGVTGTNGKTTTVALLEPILEAAGVSTMTIGSLTPHQPGRPPNTPEAPELQATLAAALEAGTSAVAMEVSSIGIAQHRVDGTWFSVGVFTNLTQDHLEFHGDMESYFAAKRSLFTEDRVGAAVVNLDDPYGRRLLDELKGSSFPVHTYSIEDGPVPLQLPGEHNQSNARAALTAAQILGVDRATALEALAHVERVPGRMEKIELGQPFIALVDYAHTPDALARSLEAVRQLAGDAKVTVVFGCGGDRDHAKRPIMGDVATSLADRAVLTSDNPRSEEPMRIIDDVRKGANADLLLVEVDRRKAIREAVALASPGDVVLVAGKGHESGQEIAGEVIPFDDRQELASAIADRQRSEQT